MSLETMTIEDFLVEYKPLPRIDPEEVIVRLELGEMVELVTKPYSYQIKGSEVIINLNGVAVHAYLRQLGSSVDEILLRLRTTCRWFIRKVGNRYVVTRVEPFIRIGEKEFDIARHLLELYPALDVILIGMGYRIEPDVVRIMLPRILPLIYDDQPLHIFQMTRVESGKSHFGIWAMLTLSWGYTTAPPTPAGMFWDARTGTYGLALTSEGIVFDEVNKWSATQMQMSGIMSYLPTFLENGVVVRPVTKAHGVGVIARRMNTIWFGNCKEFQGGDEKDVANQLFTQWGDTEGALLDRFAIIHVEHKPIRILDYVTYRVLPESIMYAVIQLVKRRRVEHECRSNLSGRQRRHSCAIQTACKKLNIDIDHDMADYAVTNGWMSMWETFGSMHPG